MDGSNGFREAHGGERRRGRVIDFHGGIGLWDAGLFVVHVPIYL